MRGPSTSGRAKGGVLAGMERLPLLMVPCRSALTFPFLPMREKLLSSPFYKWEKLRLGKRSDPSSGLHGYSDRVWI